MSPNGLRMWRAVWTTFVVTEIPILLVALDAGHFDWRGQAIAAVAVLLRAILKVVQFTTEANQ